MTHVLVVDDEAHIREVVQYAFEKEGYRVSLAENGEDGLRQLEADVPDLLILDVMLPGVDGLQLCRRIRQHHALPILFVSARGEEIDRILGLELGGDDYLPKPFSPRELVARARAILRRAEGRVAAARSTKPITLGDVVLDRTRHACTVGGQALELTATEFLILEALLAHPGIVFSRGQLMEHAFDSHITERTVDTHIKRIRSKFRLLSAPDPITTVHGVGYKAQET